MSKHRLDSVAIPTKLFRLSPDLGSRQLDEMHIRKYTRICFNAYATVLSHNNKDRRNVKREFWRVLKYIYIHLTRPGGTNPQLLHFAKTISHLGKSYTWYTQSMGVEFSHFFAKKSNFQVFWLQKCDFQIFQSPLLLLTSSRFLNSYCYC